MGSISDLHAQLLADPGTPTAAVVRVPSVERLRIDRALDLGADGIMLPQVRLRRRGPQRRLVAALPARRRPRRRAHDARRGLRRAVATRRSPPSSTRRILGVFQVESPAAVDGGRRGRGRSTASTSCSSAPPTCRTRMGIPGQIEHPDFTRPARPRRRRLPDATARRRDPARRRRGGRGVRMPAASRSSASGPTFSFAHAPGALRAARATPAPRSADARRPPGSRRAAPTRPDRAPARTLGPWPN